MTTANPKAASPEIRDIHASGPRVLIVEDHELLAHSLSLALRLEGFGVDIAQGPRVEDVLEQARAFAPDLVLLDFQLGGDLGFGRDLVAPLRALGTRIVMMSGSMTERHLAECLEAGCEGMVDKAQSFDDLLTTVIAVGRGDDLLTPEQRTELLLSLRKERATEATRRQVLDRLTPRECHVLEALMQGLSAERIAAEAFVSPTTVRSQIRGILQKLGCNSQLAAVALAKELGWDARELA